LIRVHFWESAIIYDNTSAPESEMYLDFGSSLAKFWSNKISHAVRKTYEHKVESGTAPANSMYGYKYDKTLKRFLIDPEVSPVVNKIFDLWDGGCYTQIDLMNELNAKGDLNARGRRWIKSSINRVLTSPFYAGKFSYHGKIFDGNHEAYIPYDRYKKRMDGMGIMKSRSLKKDFLLSGILRSPQGYVLSGDRKSGGHDSGEYVYYKSGTRAHYQISEPKAFELIDRAIAALEFSEDYEEYLIKYFSERIQEREAEEKDQVKFLSHRIGALKGENKKLLDLIIKGVDPDTVRDRMAENRDLITNLENQAQRKEIDVHKFIMSATTAIQYCRQFPTIYQLGTTQEKAQLLRDVISRIDVTDAEARIHFRAPFTFIFSESVLGVRDFDIMHLQQVDVRTRIREQIDSFIDYLAA
jgi:hypothetical protein